MGPVKIFIKKTKFKNSSTVIPLNLIEVSKYQTFYILNKCKTCGHNFSLKSNWIMSIQKHWFGKFTTLSWRHLKTADIKGTMISPLLPENIRRNSHVKNAPPYSKRKEVILSTEMGRWGQEKSVWIDLVIIALLSFSPHIHFSYSLTITTLGSV